MCDEIYKKTAKVKDMYEVVKRKVDADTYEHIEAFISKFGLNREIYRANASKRYYPRGSLAAHVIGFTNSEGVGVYGIEAYYNNIGTVCNCQKRAFRVRTIHRSRKRAGYRSDSGYVYPV